MNGARRKLRRIPTFAVVLLAIAFATLTPTACSSGGSSDDSDDSSGLSGSITVTSGGGSYGDFVKNNLIKPYEKKTGVKVKTVDTDAIKTLMMIRAAKSNPALIVDVPEADPPGSFPAASEDLLIKLDPEKLPNMKYAPPKWGVAKQGRLIASLSAYECLAYNTNIVKTPPKSWEDLWDSKYKGKVSIPDLSSAHGFMFMMMASQLSSGELYNGEGAIDELKKLKSNIAFYWVSHDQLTRAFASGEVAVASWVIDRVLSAKANGVPVNCVVPQEGAITFAAYMGIPKTSRNPDAAYAYINDYVLNPEIQAERASEVFLGPTTTKAELDPELKDYLNPMKEGLIAPNWETVAKLGDPWTKMWNEAMR